MRRRVAPRDVVVTAAAAALLALAPSGALAARPAASAGAPITRGQADAILGELKAIRQLLEKQQAAPQPACPPQQVAAPERKVTLPPGTVMALGRADAPLTLVEFADYQCPYCRQFHIASFELLKRDWIDTGKLRFIARELPLPFHANATNAATAARCAGEQDQYWNMRAVLQVNAANLDTLAITQFAADLKLDTTRFAACMHEKRYDALIRKDTADANAVGITGTPTFVLGPTQKAGAQGTVLVGAMPYADLDAKLKALLPR